MALGAGMVLLAQGVTEFLTKIFGKLKVKFHVFFSFSCVNTVNHIIEQKNTHTLAIRARYYDLLYILSRVKNPLLASCGEYYYFIIRPCNANLPSAKLSR